MRRTSIGLGAVGVLVLSCAILWGAQGPASVPAGAGGKVRIGTYDPRAVAVAYAASPEQQVAMKRMMDQYRQARAAKDEKRVAELKEQGEAGQRRLHRQGFAGAPVDDILAKMADRLPDVARVTSVSVITRKADYVEAGVETVDVTDEIVRLFEPSAKTLKTIEELKKTKPIGMEELEKAEKNGKI